MMLLTLILSIMSTTKLTSAARILTIYIKSERRDIEDNATSIDDIKYDQANANSMKYDHLLAIAQIKIENSDSEDENKYIDSINKISAS